MADPALVHASHTLRTTRSRVPSALPGARPQPESPRPCGAVVQEVSPSDGRERGLHEGVRVPLGAKGSLWGRSKGGRLRPTSRAGQSGLPPPHLPDAWGSGRGSHAALLVSQAEPRLDPWLESPCQVDGAPCSQAHRGSSQEKVLVRMSVPRGAGEGSDALQPHMRCSKGERPGLWCRLEQLSCALPLTPEPAKCCRPLGSFPEPPQV